MGIKVKLHHLTRYRYDRAVALSPQVIRLRPAPHSRTDVLSYSLKITPAAHFLNWQQDPHGNWLARAVFPDPVEEFVVSVDLVADLAVINPFDFFLAPEAETFPLVYPDDLAEDLRAFLVHEPAGPRLAAYLATIPTAPPVQTIDFLVALNQRLQHDIRYTIRHEPGVQTPEETLTLRSGSCRDSAWLLVRILRHLGLAARFVSGYLIQLVPDEKPIDGPAGPAADFTDLHAWTEVYLPGAGWVGLDPTSGLFAGEGHIPLAATPQPTGAAPITGAVDPCEVTFGHEMAVSRIEETPRVTKPYDEAQWRAVLALGAAVDQRLQAGDVRLTQGGEPTFVSALDMDGEEWTVAAVGPTKRAHADALIRRLRARFAPGGLLTFGQGKWYPGESLPRWAFTLVWREDGEPVWQDDGLIAREGIDHRADADTAARFTAALAERLGVDPAFAQPAFEDPGHYLRREQALPLNVDPLDSRLDDPEERARLARVFGAGLRNPIGMVLPLQPWHSRDGLRWVTGPWPTRQGRLIAMPGDSPLGFRLPLGSLPWLAASDYPYHIERDPFEPRDPLPERRQLSTARAAGHPEAVRPRLQRAAEAQGVRPGERGLVSDTVRSALCVQPREGCLNLFLPPLETAEQYLDLVAAIEDTARDLTLPVRLEGYPPPQDPRLKVIKVTPDPGVIEVNVQPARDWAHLVEITETLYDEARHCRLGSEKFMIDGRHVGTGGGNHMVLGGPSAPDSPFLRRPDLLGSLIRFWQNHPSLSYLFSGLFIGPTSQHPRLDEARDDSLYELEIALGQIPPAGTTVPPWLIDRILRNLLADVTGNTHRTELSIDKLYSPDGPTGRLGLVEFRCFEMPPHPRMSLVQQLLLRAMVALFWDQPYQEPVVRWGSALRDRFMLPHWVERDFARVLDWLRRGGFAFDPAWFAPHLEFRFPLIGRFDYDGVEVELRTALEPWHVMGEEPGSGGTVRYVDSSVERLQVKARNLTTPGLVLACNGRRVPLAPTGTNGEWVAGIRYRAWNPPSSLHPTIGVHSPLTIDLVDRHSDSVVAGCSYHVAHPGGRNYVTFPVNSFEAEARRRARFQPFGHAQRQPAAEERGIHPDYPNTLDLRR
ncbi:DUF2126 domain-containing protein [Phaeospirillum tilakii]|uniref:DUF2126 domain-containing protein n=1 Tax=Phaeospirillum tilakii TaxID=741673 RepID=A0ABW5C8P9_9PROT